MKVLIFVCLIFGVIYSAFTDREKKSFSDSDKLKIYVMNQAGFKDVKPVLDIKPKSTNGKLCADLVYKTPLGTTYETYCREGDKNYLLDVFTVKSR